jgi:hypothetical protein
MGGESGLKAPRKALRRVAKDAKSAEEGITTDREGREAREKGVLRVAKDAEDAKGQ